jgi:hypothetical protein
MLTTLRDITVPFQELYGQDSGSIVEEDVNYQGATATKSFLVDWDQRWQFIIQVMGRVSLTGGSGGTIATYSPLVYPDYPALFCKAANIKGYGDFGGGFNNGYSQIRYDHAIVTLTFGTVAYNYDGSMDPNGTTPGTYRSVAMEFGSQMLELPAGAYRYGSGGPPVTKGVGRIVPTANVTITQHFAPYIPFGTIFALVGNVNSQTFYFAPAGYVLFLGCSSQADFSVTSDTSSWTVMQQITYKFAYRAIKWNQIMTENGSGFADIVDGSGNGPYPTADLNTLFFYGSSAPSF